MPRTRTELIAETLEALGVLAAGEAPEPEDSARVDSRITSKLAELAATGVIDLADEQSFEDEVFAPLTLVVAEACCGAFGIAGDKRQELAADRAAAVATLRRVSRSGAQYFPLAVEHF